MGYRPISFIVDPHPQDIDHVGSLVDAVDQSMLAVDATRIRASQFADEFFIGRGGLPRVFYDASCQLGNPAIFSLFGAKKCDSHKHQQYQCHQ